jgi:hypothetical protein
MGEHCPRVNFETLQLFQGRRVLLVGEVKTMESGKVVVKTADDGEVTVLTNPGGAGWDTPFVEVGLADGRQLVCAETQSFKSFSSAVHVSGARGRTGWPHNSGGIALQLWIEIWCVLV